MGLARMFRGVQKRLRPRRIKPSILMYHRVADLKHDPWGLAVSPVIFDRQMRYLRESRLPMTVEEMADRLRQGTLPQKAIAVTFDDAYLDNLVHAKPSLVRYDIPALVFVPTAYVGRKVPFWWDELSSMILDCQLPHDDVQACGSDEVLLKWEALERDDHDPEWRGWEAPKTMRQAAYLALWSRMQKMNEEERAPVLRSLRQRFKIAVDPVSLPMDKTQLEQLVAGDLVCLGAHTTSHASLSDGSLQDGRREIRESKVQCGLYTTKAVTGFAYPYGNMTTEVCEEVEAAGYSFGCAAEAGFLDEASTDLYALPRIPAPNFAGPDFATLLTG